MELDIDYLRGYNSNIITDVGGDTANKVIYSSSNNKIDYDLIKEYVRDIETRTGRKLYKNQVE